MTAARVRRASPLFARDGDLAADEGAQKSHRQTLREMAQRGRGSLAQMMAGRALIDCGAEWHLARVRLVQTWRGPMPDLRRADALLAACGVPAGVQTDIFGRDVAETVEVER